jgi:hypothetical protein
MRRNLNEIVHLVQRHNGVFYNTCTLKWCLHSKVDFKTNARYIMLMFHNCSRYKAGLLQKGCIITLLSNTPEYDAPFQSAGLARSTIL